MLLDIQLKEVNIGDSVIMTRGYGLVLAQFIKETKCQLHFKLLPSAVTKTTFIFYINKGSSRANVYKV